ncbi:MAG: hypothetical protein BZY88_05440 [SAR202 cluster bacterium Io17-Chloro-G9]|nr:MAG: hypothetical protein BZY88_05440 [SAR202 cluster bacterium Io17-Chloro-G9]
MKICSLLPSGTEILYSLGLGEQLAGVSDLCDYPPASRTKPVVCYSKIDASVLSSEEVENRMQELLATGEPPYDLDQEWMERTCPDVILTQDLCYFCEVDASVVSGAVAALPAQPKLVVLSPRNLDEIFGSFLQVGEACGADKAAHTLISSLRDRVQAVVDSLAQVGDRPKVFSLEGVNPLVIGGHWIPDLLQLAGGQQDLYPPGCSAQRLQWQQVLDYEPEKLYIDLCSSDLDRGLREVGWLAAQPGWKALPAVRSGEVYLIDHVYFSRPGPRVVQGLEILAQLTHPHMFAGLIPPKTVVKLDPELANGCSAEDIGRCFQPYPAASH